MLAYDVFKSITILICNQRSQDEQMGCLYRHWKKCQLENGFASMHQIELGIYSYGRIIGFS